MLTADTTVGSGATTAYTEETAHLARGRDRSIDYLRTTLTVMVLAHHSTLAYTTWASFDKAHVLRSTAPVVDSARWIFFDYAENFNDVFFMSLMFFVSGIFVFSAIRRHGTWGFIRDRLLRLGVPFAFAVCVFMPIAFFASWQLGIHNNGFFDFYFRIAKTGFLVGPPWFIWVLLLFDLVLALLVIPGQRLIEASGYSFRALKNRSVLSFTLMLVFSGCFYLPLLSHYGFGTWTVLWTSPFAFQQARIGLYALWFAMGVLVGVPGFNNGLLSRTGSLARHWRWWLGGCFVAYNLLFFVPRLLESHGVSVATGQVLEALLWVVSCVASCFGFLAMFRGIEIRARTWMNSLSRSAYAMYLVHYAFVTWTQRLVLRAPIAAGLKFLVVFSLTLSLSWLTAQVLLRIPALRAIL